MKKIAKSTATSGKNAAINKATSGLTGTTTTATQATEKAMTTTTEQGSAVGNMLKGLLN
ncbi:hypothetical protein [Kingella negevensis]|uniref:hypothetical protein n=1 Tax=Kingella negevensis TaxID=1522312 RepID=UPI000AB5396C|nr:hypothetical protein [Kingella negevensis]MDK4687715.1 hypothetical protein [Kingella negevensis]WII91290.1 hypothetical protein QEO93_01460 [Kingella negevensis]